MLNDPFTPIREPMGTFTPRRPAALIRLDTHQQEVVYTGTTPLSGLSTVPTVESLLTPPMGIAPPPALCMTHPNHYPNVTTPIRESFTSMRMWAFVSICAMLSSIGTLFLRVGEFYTSWILGVGYPFSSWAVGRRALVFNVRGRVL